MQNPAHAPGILHSWFVYTPPVLWTWWVLVGLFETYRLTSHTTSTRLRGKLGTSEMLRRSSKPLSAELGEEKCSRAISAAEHPPG